MDYKAIGVNVKNRFLNSIDRESHLKKSDLNAPDIYPKKKPSS